MQSAAGQLTESRLAILEAETGSGKTEAALWRFKQLFEEGEVDGLYFALPTRIAATQIHRRVHAGRCPALAWTRARRPACCWRCRATSRSTRPGGERSCPASRCSGATIRPRPRRTERWAAENPKRFLAAQIAVGTIDQALLSNLQVRHAHLRSTALLRHLLVVDEVHASDAYMTALLRSVLPCILPAGGHALLMSATLGSVARTAYLAGGVRRSPGLGQAIALPYPCLSLAQGGRRAARPVRRR